MNFSEKILQLRKERNLSQEQLAEILEVSRQTISKWETGEAMPEVEKLVRISDCFGVSLDYLLREERTDREVMLEKMTERPHFGKMTPGMIRVAAWTLLAVGACLIIALGNDGTLFVYWPLSRMVWGILVQLLTVGGYTVLACGMDIPRQERSRFWVFAVWLLALTPLVLGVKIFCWMFLGRSILALLLVLPSVLVVCVVITLRLTNGKIKKVEENS